MNADMKKKIEDAANKFVTEQYTDPVSFETGAEYGFKLCQEQAEQILVKALEKIAPEKGVVVSGDGAIRCHEKWAYEALDAWAKLVGEK